ncbi:BadM/Rrf2 family transcriptional regulator [Lachnotalea glycerini]|jgi:Rrf2 family protein|uniref:Rrf2 family transcriptional regulator n=1 Tax=Lachnotalea glycerini TaxID=1763509 RepID=A0A255IL38_9FIRM|nr:Rrf2 family transcriptional regulator [Lachnotalea glycerini]PXV96014.1 BadM/Rrf2 family transcriptional regulator [Lachnotalea glycerini]RDY30192.1 Rrf2 family transcriptional regulator [Lachnotalea glycerini]
MKISTKGRYALRLMLDLALYESEGYVKIKDIAKRQDLSDKYLEQIITILSRAGYVKSIRGASGGYKLAKLPAEYTVGMILRLTEGSLSPVACLDGDVADCTRYDNCATLEVWKRLNDAINTVVDSMTLADLIDIQTEKNQLNFVI